MARVRRTNSPTPTAGHTPQSRRVPVILTCPVCDLLLGDTKAEVHLQGHKPTVGCIMCLKHDRWVLDMDSVAHPHTSDGLFFCNNCGRFAPVTTAPALAAIPQDMPAHTDNTPDTQGNTDEPAPVVAE